MTLDQKTIAELDPTVNPRWVEGFMRLQYGNLNNLDLQVYKEEIKLFKLCQIDDPNHDWESNAKSFGL